MLTQLFVLAVYSCHISGACDYEAYKIYDSKADCEQAIYDERIINGDCFPVDGIIRREEINR